MFNVDEGNNITITRGDTASLEVRLTGDAPQDGDSVVLSVKASASRPQAVFEKTADTFEAAPEGEEGVIARFYIDAADTAGMAFGAYRWDLRIFYADGEVVTPMTPRRFDVAEVITNNDR